MKISNYHHFCGKADLNSRYVIRLSSNYVYDYFPVVFTTFRVHRQKISLITIRLSGNRTCEYIERIRVCTPINNEAQNTVEIIALSVFWHIIQFLAFILGYNISKKFSHTILDVLSTIYRILYNTYTQIEAKFLHLVTRSLCLRSSAASSCQSFILSV